MLKNIFFIILILITACGVKKDEKVFFRQPESHKADTTIQLMPGSFITAEKVNLGRYLFYDTRLSINNTKSCASCHSPVFSFTDSYRRSIGALGDLTRHNSPPLINLVYNYFLTFADSSLHFPEQQINNPMFNQHPVELGWNNNEPELLKRIKADTMYRRLFNNAYPLKSEPITVSTIQTAISSFVKTIISFNSPWDKYRKSSNKEAVSASALRGARLFQSEELSCYKCHGGVNFNIPSAGVAPYFNTGFFTDTTVNKGLAEFTHQKIDIGKYRIPTLRNLAFTAPYLHDGSAETLEAVIMTYEKGGNSGAINKHPLIKGFKLNSQQRQDIISFLLSLSDTSVTNNPQYSNPFETQ
jgi:cytochrome c peroxidase